MRTIVDLLRHAARVHASNPCMTYRVDGRRENYTYAEILDLSLRAATLLRTLGIGPDDRVIIWGPNRPEWGIAYFATLLLGAIAVPFDTRATEAFLRTVESKTEPKLLIAGKTQQELATLPHAPYLTLDTLVEHARSHEPADNLPEISPESIAALMYTSGTTGNPKGVILSHDNISSNLQAVPEVIKIESYFRLLSLLPLSHVLEQVVGLLVPMLGGASTVYIDTLKPPVIFEAMEQEGVTMMVAVPQLLQLFMNGIEREVRRQGKERIWNALHTVAQRLPFGARRYLFPSIHKKLGGRFEFFASGGAYLPPTLAQKWENLGIKILQGYGLTEASPIVAANPIARRKLDSIGRVVSCVRVRIASDSEILIQGPSVFHGYWQDPAATKEAFEDGWYHTGDMGHFDGDGYLYFSGRKKNVIVLASGLNVHAEDVENALRETQLVTDAVVIAMPNAQGEAMVHAILALEDHGKANDAIRLANKQLAAHQHVRSHSIWPEADFPRTHTMKVRRPEVLKKISNGSLIPL